MRPWASSLGAVDYITKPFSAELVKARVKNHLELKHHQDHLEELVAERTLELKLTQEVTIYSLANLVETRDPETGGHILRTQRYVRALARRLQQFGFYREYLSDRTIDRLFKSAPLHDIGKVGVEDRILLKPDRLTPNEFEEMKKHTIYGREALRLAEEKLGSTSFLRYAWKSPTSITRNGTVPVIPTGWPGRKSLSQAGSWPSPMFMTP